MIKRVLLVMVAILFLAATDVFAGTGYSMKCKKCGFSADVLIGGGVNFEQITGFCVSSGEFVYLTWDRGAKKPDPMAKVWDSATGKMIEIYKCPNCPHPFIPLRLKDHDEEEGPGFKHCPKCGKGSFQVDKSQGLLMFD